MWTETMTTNEYENEIPLIQPFNYSMKGSHKPSEAFDVLGDIRIL